MLFLKRLIYTGFIVLIAGSAAFAYTVDRMTGSEERLLHKTTEINFSLSPESAPQLMLERELSYSYNVGPGELVIASSYRFGLEDNCVKLIIPKYWLTISAGRATIQTGVTNVRLDSGSGEFFFVDPDPAMKMAGFTYNLQNIRYGQFVLMENTGQKKVIAHRLVYYPSENFCLGLTETALVNGEPDNVYYLPIPFETAQSIQTRQTDADLMAGVDFVYIRESGLKFRGELVFGKKTTDLLGPDTGAAFELTIPQAVTVYEVGVDLRLKHVRTGESLYPEQWTFDGTRLGHSLGNGASLTKIDLVHDLNSWVSLALGLGYRQKSLEREALIDYRINGEIIGMAGIDIYSELSYHWNKAGIPDFNRVELRTGLNFKLSY